MVDRYLGIAHVSGIRSPQPDNNHEHGGTSDILAFSNRSSDFLASSNDEHGTSLDIFGQSAIPWSKTNQGPFNGQEKVQQQGLLAPAQRVMAL